MHQKYLKKKFESLKLHLTKCAEFEKIMKRNCLRFHLEREKLLKEFYGLWNEIKAIGAVLLN